MNIAQELKTQDNLATAHPMFLVQEFKIRRGMRKEWSDTSTYMNEEGDLSDNKNDFEEEPEEIATYEYWDFVTACFTRKAAEQFIARQEHNFGPMRIYVGSAHNNPEWQRVRKVLCPNL